MTVQMKSFSSDQVYLVHVNDATHKADACRCPEYFHHSRRTPGQYFCKHMRSHEENRLAAVRMSEASY